MAAMDAGWARRGAWFPFFVLAVGTFVGSVVAAGVMLYRAAGEQDLLGRADPAEAGDSSAARLPLTYLGVLPASLTDEDLAAATDQAKADVIFQRSSSPDAVPVRYFVPVASLAAGLDRVTSAQLLGLLDGSLTLAQAGGIGGAATELGPDIGADAELLAAYGPAPDAVVSGGYEALVKAVASRPDAIAFVPLDFVTFAVSALNVDGVDIVRGVGDPASWPYTERVKLTARSERGKAALPGLQAKLATTLPKVTKVIATGDILQSRCSLTAIEATGDWGAAVRGPMAEYLASADLTLGSLDGSIQDIGQPYGCVATTNLTSPPETIQALTLAGFDEMTVATNHVFDCGQTFCGTRAFLRTLELLDQAGIKHVGGGNNLEEALAPVIFEVNGTKFGVLGFDDVAAYELEATDTEPGTAPLDDSYAEENAAGEPAFFRPAEELSLNRFTARIRALKQQVDVVIVQVQTGTEDTHDPSPRSIKALRAAAAAGADLIIGNQAHHVQAVETTEGSFIAYALGNFIFDQVHTPEHTQGYLVEATFWGKQLANVRLVPYQIEDKYRPEFAEAPLRAKILEDVFAASERLPAH
ncbi:MAG TPA: CapA family protein [Tepidiformaceae bacterium]|nr:CapA family protein [Tepidiformaceae bacterium]